MDKDLFKISGISTLFASMCCLSPILLFIFGLSTAAFATSLTDTLYGTYAWAFRLLGLVLLAVGFVWYYRKKGICTLNQVKQQRNKIINTVLLTLIITILAYLFFLYVVVHYWGVWLNIW